ncbi:N-acetylmuramic acid 6-phosphate etherase [bioreactor metagenome]|uniref:N-acetylmuramic acid 6-phosphate etherase n=1 Tax=bioreactor metagenome TaxID=1076179 RepID=A0A645BG70_9ZZZZ|nr:N-acetylmuramic acid 6-phosphate etherase [Oscillospiraceae bacterium]
MENYNSYLTERNNEKSAHIDRMSAYEIAKLINDEDKTVAFAVEKELINIAAAIDAIAERIKAGGRLIYIGAGTSGRLGVLDAAECPPTYGVSKETVMGILAGGYGALVASSEGAEDSAEQGIADVKAAGLCAKDALFGISASGSAGYVNGSVKYAKELGALTVGLSCHGSSTLSSLCDIAITPAVGPEVISGSTRMKAATAQKMVLTTISTGVMVKLGRVHGNMMVYMNPANVKLRNRAQRMIEAETGATATDARAVLEKAGYDIKKAIDLLKAK